MLGGDISLILSRIYKLEVICILNPIEEGIFLFTHLESSKFDIRFY